MTGTTPAQQEGHRVVALVPLYRPDAEHLDNVRSLLQQVDAVVAVDDGSGQDYALGLASLATDAIRVDALKVNSGIAAAMNAGVRTALECGATHVLTIDQDSRLGPRYVHEALAALATLSRLGVHAGALGAGIVGSSRLGGAESIAGSDARSGINSIQSGWVIPRETLTAVGQFDERLFIDCVDTDFAIRCELAQRRIVITDACRIEHQLGAGQRRLVTFRGRGAFAFHPPLRRYYITRNRLVMLKRYGARRPALLLRQTFRETRIAVACLVVGPARGRQLRAVAHGVVDAARNRLGGVDPGLSMRLRL